VMTFKNREDGHKILKSHHLGILTRSLCNFS